VHLAPDEREADAELAQRLRDAVHHRGLDGAFVAVAVHRQEVQDVRVTGDLLREIRIVAIEETAEVGCLRPGALERARPEVVHQDVPRPAVLDSGLGVAFPSDGIRLRQERSDVPPRQSVHTLWTN
jgi:hypothetical protein